jgi:hypothetical protein
MSSPNVTSATRPTGPIEPNCRTTSPGTSSSACFVPMLRAGEAGRSRVVSSHHAAPLSTGAVSTSIPATTGNVRTSAAAPASAHSRPAIAATCAELTGWSPT